VRKLLCEKSICKDSRLSLEELQMEVSGGALGFTLERYL